MTRQEQTAAIKAKVATLTWGTELETTGLGTAEAANVLARFFGTARQYRGGIYTKYEVRDQRGRKWSCVTDASVTGSREGHAAEIVTPALDASEEDFELVGQVAQALRRGGAKVDKTCGEHIHVGTYDTNGTERITFKQIANIVKLWAGKESLILDAFNVSEYRRINWCCPIDTQRGSSRSRGFLDQIRALRDFTSEAINRAWFGFYYASPDHYDETRYHSLNLNNVWRESRTIEFRIFNGTLNPTKIKARALFALHVAAAGCIKANTLISTPNMNGEQSRCYKMRCFLLDIGMIGEEYRAARHEILRHLEGDTAWRTEAQRIENARRRRNADRRDDMEAEAADQRRAEREAQQNEQNAEQEAATAWNAAGLLRVWESANATGYAHHYTAPTQLHELARATGHLQEVWSDQPTGTPYFAATLVAMAFRSNTEFEAARPILIEAYNRTAEAARTSTAVRKWRELLANAAGIGQAARFIESLGE